MEVLEGFVAIGLATVNALLAAALFVVYLGIWSRVRSSFGLGLVTFAAAFTIQNVLLALTYLFFMELMPDVLTPFLLAATAVETVALGVMAISARV